jgi:hypothetical protein
MYLLDRRCENVFLADGRVFVDNGITFGTRVGLGTSVLDIVSLSHQ